ncbi:protein E6A [Proboscivirus elephantidbeta4]|uniref:Protein E6A n=1 Tax=Elephant endotheliotropic herpesvirus 4 TaxID=548914 RepID=A0A0S1TRM7_9BETA|nr:protein E6A [Elephant endotheliotropic herpesvirus 4]ALM25934.1 protein E6A [Elephant endotheliotropic herpesvirus 4]
MTAGAKPMKQPPHRPARAVRPMTAEERIEAYGWKDLFLGILAILLFPACVVILFTVTVMYGLLKTLVKMNPHRFRPLNVWRRWLIRWIFCPLINLELMLIQGSELNELYRPTAENESEIEDPVEKIPNVTMANSVFY